MLLTCLSVLNTFLIGVFIVILLKFKASIPDLLHDTVQAGLDTVGETFSGIFEKPQVKRAMSVLGKESGNVRADKALKTKVAEKALGQSVIVKKALDYFGLSALEGIELMQDPTFGPIIQGFIAKGGQGLLKGFTGNGNQGQTNTRGRGVPLMS